MSEHHPMDHVDVFRQCYSDSSDSEESTSSFDDFYLYSSDHLSEDEFEDETTDQKENYSDEVFNFYTGPETVLIKETKPYVKKVFKCRPKEEKQTREDVEKLVSEINVYLFGNLQKAIQDRNGPGVAHALCCLGPRKRWRRTLSRLSVSSLKEAARVGSVIIFNYLLGEGFWLEPPGELSLPVLHVAAKSGSLEVVKRILELGVDVNLATKPSVLESDKGYVGQTALHTLVEGLQRKNTEMVEFLVSQGADTERPDGNGNTPLHLAVLSHCASEEMIETLIRCGACVNRDRGRGYRPLAFAVMVGHLKITKMLLKAGAIPGLSAEEDELKEAVHSGHMKIVKCLLRYNCPDNSGRLPRTETPLYHALRCSKQHYRVPLTRVLLAFGHEPEGIQEDDIRTKGLSEQQVETLKSAIMFRSSNPRSLQEICAFKIRSHLGPKLLHSVMKLPVTAPVTEFILMKHALRSC